MIATPFRTSRTLGSAAKRRLAASAVAPVAFGYERSADPVRAKAHCDALFSRTESTICPAGDRQ